MMIMMMTKTFMMMVNSMLIVTAVMATMLQMRGFSWGRIKQESEMRRNDDDERHNHEA